MMLVIIVMTAASSYLLSVSMCYVVTSKRAKLTVLESQRHEQETGLREVGTA